MATKRIQLRGISRTPSDRMTADGGCAESLNVYLDDSELAPVLKPKDITEEIKLPNNSEVKDVFIHNTPTSKNHILISRTEDVLPYRILTLNPATNEYRTVVTLENKEEINDITAIGNTVIIAGTKSNYYLLFRANEYEFLGNTIPRIAIELNALYYENHPNKADSAVLRFYTNTYQEDAAHPDYITIDGEKKYLSIADMDAWTAAISQNAQELDYFNKRFWSEWQNKMLQLARGGLFYYPLMLRYAVKLYDGTYTHQSIPILVGAGHKRMMECSLDTDYYGPAEGDLTRKDLFANIKLNYAYVIEAKVRSLNFIEKWKDIIQSIDLFVSEPLIYPQVNSAFAQIEEVDDKKMLYFQFAKDSAQEDSAIENMLTGTSNFYLLKSYSADNFSSIIDSEIIENSKDLFMTESLFTKTRLPDDFRSNHEYLSETLSSYNNRLLASGIKEKLYSGEPQASAAAATSEEYEDKGFVFYYRIANASGEDSLVRSKGFGASNEIILPPTKVLTINEAGLPSSSGYYSSKQCGWIVYPDTRCTVAYFKEAKYENNTAVPWKEITMKPHPFLQCSYAYLGIDQDITEIDSLPTQIGSFKENNIGDSYLGSYLFQSSVDNPFFFPAAGRVRLSGNIIGFATASAAMSQGQFGQFPLYAFTSEGIWAIEIANDGSFVSSKPISREVCINAKSITPIDQAVIFMTDKGLMLLSGSEIKELSPHMNGKHYTVEETAKIIIENQEGFSDHLSALKSHMPFMEFMKDATIGYDYAGKRLICCNKKENYQYIYKFNTATWHKLSHYGYTINKPLNSYPSCEVIATDKSKITKVLDLSTFLDVTDTENPEKAIIATRPFDLDEPDVLKTISNVRIRGQFAKGAVKFILLGSNDNITYYTINTLRGRAWKIFKVILLADLEKTDRISWIDIQYEPRFTNRLR